MVDFDPLTRMVPVGRMEGVGLYKINPDYYDRSPGAPGAQLIFVYYQIPNLSAFEKTNLNYLEKNTITIFNENEKRKGLLRLSLTLVRIKLKKKKT
jgi:hypothetical protein